MTGVRKNTKKFSRSTFFLMFFFAFFIHFSFDIDTIYAVGEASSVAEIEAAKEKVTKEEGSLGKILTNCSTSAPGWEECKASGGVKGNSRSIIEAAGNIVIDGIKWFLYGIFTFVSWLAIVAAHIFSYVLDPKKFQEIMDNAVVYEMWRIVRDFFNLFFIFSLLIVAFSTIFQVSKYGGLKAVWNIVLAALFINFSFPIARMIIDVGNVMMYSFINDMFGMTGDSLNRGILSTSGIKGLFLLDKFDGNLELLYYLVAIVGMFMFGVSFLTLSLMMLYRLIMLPILVMFAPIGFAGSAIPGMSKYASQWWDKLIKNVFFGPIAVFMVLLAVKFLGTLAGTSSPMATDTGITAGIVSANGASGSLIAAAVYMVIPIMFFWIAITSAEKLSSEASGMANSFGSKFLKWTGKTAGGFAYRKVERLAASNKYTGKYTKYLVPSVAIKAWTDRAKEHEAKDQEDLDLASASMQDELNAGISRGTDSWFGLKPWKLKKAMLHPSDRTNHAYAARAHMAAKAQKEVSEVSTNSDYLIEELDAAVAKKDDTAVAGIIKALTKDNNLNDLMAARGDRYNLQMQEYEVDVLDAEGKPTGEKIKKSAPVISPENYKKLIEGMLKDSGMEPNSEAMALTMLDISETATASGNYGAGGMIKYNTQTKKWETQSSKEQATWAAGKVKNLEAQKRQQQLHPDSMFKYYYDEKGTRHILDLTDAGVEIMKTFTAADNKHSDRTREDYKVGMHELMEKMTAGGKDVPEKYKALINSEAGAKAYAEAIEMHYKAKNDAEAKK